MKEALDSDRVNYLIWRYLLESNYRETAAKLQKEWRIQAPHRHFGFAPHVKNYALVSTLNKGLIYESLERDYVQTQEPAGDATATAAVDNEPRGVFGVFGPFVPQPPVNADQLKDEEEPSLPSSEPAADDVKVNSNADKSQAQAQSQSQAQSLKRQVDSHGQLANGNSAKRPRLGNANGLENGADTATSPMELDQHQSDNHAYPSPLEGEQAPTPAPRTEGPDHATQTDKVDDLEAKTTYLRLASDDSASSVAATPTVEASHLRTNQSPLLLQCEWNPKDPSRLAATGTDALARVWTVSRATCPEQVADHVDPGWPSINLVGEECPPSTKVSAFSWAFDGKQIAVATDDERKARIDLWDLQGKLIHHWEELEIPIIKLKCNPSNHSILSISPSPIKNSSGDSKGWVVTIFPSVSDIPVEYLVDADVFSQPADVSWMNETDFVLCWGTKMATFKFANRSIIQLKEFATRQDDNLSGVQYSGWGETGCIAAATAKGYIDVWDESGQRRSNDAPAHDGPITALRWQPCQSSKPDSEWLLASGGEDGTIAIRDARLPDIKAKFETTIDHNPVLALAFTPDGAFIAGATRDRVLIWKVGEYTAPRAQWTRTSPPGRLSPKMNGTSDVEDEHCLCWDANGQKLAFGVNDLQHPFLVPEELSVES